jgi:hypothetical protein
MVKSTCKSRGACAAAACESAAAAAAKLAGRWGPAFAASAAGVLSTRRTARPCDSSTAAGEAASAPELAGLLLSVGAVSSFSMLQLPVSLTAVMCILGSPARLSAVCAAATPLRPPEELHRGPKLLLCLPVGLLLLCWMVWVCCMCWGPSPSTLLLHASCSRRIARSIERVHDEKKLFRILICERPGQRACVGAVLLHLAAC